jgi:hypothetical protein
MSKGTKTSSPALHQAARQLGHAGGVKGGPARAAKLSSSRKSAIARSGGRARGKK